jgi:hypothetical protein
MLALWIPLLNEVTRYRLFIFFNRSYRKTAKITLAVSYSEQGAENVVVASQAPPPLSHKSDWCFSTAC